MLARTGEGGTGVVDALSAPAWQSMSVQMASGNTAPRTSCSIHRCCAGPPICQPLHPHLFALSAHPPIQFTVQDLQKGSAAGRMPSSGKQRTPARRRPDPQKVSRRRQLALHGAGSESLHTRPTRLPAAPEAKKTMSVSGATSDATTSHSPT